MPRKNHAGVEEVAHIRTTSKFQEHYDGIDWTKTGDEKTSNEEKVSPELDSSKVIRTTRFATLHFLKLDPIYYGPALLMHKNFEIRKDDRDPCFQVGHFIRLDPYERDSETYTGQLPLLRKITYITSYAQESGYVVLGLERVSLDDPSFRNIISEYPDVLRAKA